MLVDCYWCGEKTEKQDKEVRRKLRNGNSKFFCGLSCSAKYKNSLKSQDGVSEKQMRNIAREMYKGEWVCSACGHESHKNDIHHIDGNPNNNSLDNLDCLCRGCHVALHNKQRDTGRGRISFDRRGRVTPTP